MGRENIFIFEFPLISTSRPNNFRENKNGIARRVQRELCIASH